LGGFFLFRNAFFEQHLATTFGLELCHPDCYAGNPRHFIAGDNFQQRLRPVEHGYSIGQE
jgi:hypothetical protein